MSVCPQVYLAGPMDESDNWRAGAQIALEKAGLVVVQPELLKKYVNLFVVSEREAAKILTHRDRKFCTESDYVLANFEGATSRSMGTCVELGWADLAGTTIISVLPCENPHNHPIIHSVSDYVVSNLLHGIALVEALTWRN